MRAHLSIIAVCLGVWVAASAGCDVEVTENTSAAAAGVSVVASGSGGAGGDALNGCTRESADDFRNAESQLIITDIQPWTVPHQVCVVVNAGSQVTWQAVTATHPLAGGETPTTDANSPITLGAAEGDVTIAFPDAGEFPYFCAVHLATMQGVVYVE